MNFLWPKMKFIILETILISLEIFDLVSSISGNIEKKTTIKMNNILFSTLIKSTKINDNKNPNAKWV